MVLRKGALEAMSSKRMIRLSKSVIGDDEIFAAVSVMKREYFGMGIEVKDFESELEAYFGRPAVCVVNGTAALHLALEACGIGPGDEVLVQSLTYVASFQAISASGARPVACEIDPRNLTLDLLDAERKITENTKALMPVHYSGDPGNIERVNEFAIRNGLRVIEDAAHAFGSNINGLKIGSFGDIACFSFDGIKNITSGEGGCVVTNDLDVIRKIRDSRLLGVVNDTENRFAGKRSWEFDVRAQGWRYHMSDLFAAIGRVQLKRSNQFIQHRRHICRLYDELIKKISYLEFFERDYANVAPHIYIVKILGGYDRGKLMAYLARAGVQTGIHYKPNHEHFYYRHSAPDGLQKTEDIYPKLMTLPLHVGLSEDDVHYVVEKLSEYQGSEN